MKEKTHPDTPTSPPWRSERIGPSAVIRVREIPAETMARMPTDTRTFTDTGPIELIIRDVKELLGRK